MVQRKVSSKLGIQADHHDKTENLLVNLRSSSLQRHDVKNSKGADLKKKMKKSESIKRQEFDSLSLRRHEEQPGKPPPAAVAQPGSAATPEKQPPVTTMATIPNYMKSTTSSDARKEVSIKSPHTRPDSSSLHRKSSTLASGNKATKTLARTSSMKMMRTLTKNPSFKPARASSVKKCSPVVLCENLDAQRETCSSTLKDCKFPAYLSLNPGGTESEGTSTIKVCPYTYCSLNGHHHAPLPPLKCFLSARRRMLKTQRSIRLGCLSPRRVKPIGDGPSFDEKLLVQDDLKSSTISPLAEEDHKDFFIEIYGEKNEDTAADYTRIDGSASHSSVINLLSSVYERDETTAEDQKERALETLSDAPICYGVDIHQSLDQNGDANSMDMGTTYFSEQNQEVKVDEEVYPPLLLQEERKPGFLSELPVESMTNVQFYELDSEASDMDWETGHHSGLLLDYDYEYSPETEIEPDLEAGKLERQIIHDEFIVKSDNAGGCFDEFLVDEVSQESFDEESLNSDVFSNSNHGESTGSYDCLQNLNNMKTAAPVEVPVEEPEPACEDKNHILFECQTQRTGLPIGNQGGGYYIIAEEETSFDNLKCKSLPNEDAIAGMGDQVSNLLNGPLEESVTSGGKTMCDTITKNEIPNQNSSDDGSQLQTELSDEDQTNNTENRDNSAENFITLSPIDPAKEPYSEVAWLTSTEGERHMVHKVKTENEAKPDTEDSVLARATAKCKKSIQDRDELGLFNPRAPNFLALEPNPEAEKVDLRHQDLDERKNTEEWMVDYALRQAVTKLAPSRKRKVALLVEAFEKVTPTTKCELHLRHSSAFDQARPIQACS